MKITIYTENNLNKYNALWQYLKFNDKDEYRLTFNEIRNVLGFDIDHSFLTYKKQAEEYGYEVTKIFLKENTIVFKKLL